MKIHKISLEAFGWFLGSGKRKNIQLIFEHGNHLISESNFRFSSHSENIEFMRTDFKNLGFAKSSTMFAARYNLNAYKADEYIYLELKKKLQ